jgi:hypothetical protein
MYRPKHPFRQTGLSGTSPFNDRGETLLPGRGQQMAHYDLNLCKIEESFQYR